MSLNHPQAIYAGQLRQACLRLKAALRFHAEYAAEKSPPVLDAATLQIRKALELVAFAAIAPDKEAFARLRATDDVGDFTKDYHARKILNTLKGVNPDFYPVPLLEAVRQAHGFHFDRKASGYLTRKRFENVYDRLGKHLHATNPWGDDPNVQNLARDIPALVEEIYQLLDLHVRFIRVPAFKGAWLVRIDRDGGMPQLSVAEASGDFVDTTRS